MGRKTNIINVFNLKMMLSVSLKTVSLENMQKLKFKRWLRFLLKNASTTGRDENSVAPDLPNG